MYLPESLEVVMHKYRKRYTIAILLCIVEMAGCNSYSVPFSWSILLLFDCMLFTIFKMFTVFEDSQKISVILPTEDFLFNTLKQWLEMALGGGGPQRGTAAAAAANLRRRKTGGAGGAAGGAGGTMLQFYTDDSPGLKISPNVVLVMSIGFIAFVAILHVMGKLYFVRREG